MWPSCSCSQVIHSLRVSCHKTHNNSMQNDPVVSKASELFRLGLMPSPYQLREGKVRRNLTLPQGTFIDFFLEPSGYRYLHGLQLKHALNLSESDCKKRRKFVHYCCVEIAEGTKLNTQSLHPRARGLQPFSTSGRCLTFEYEKKRLTSFLRTKFQTDC